MCTMKWVKRIKRLFFIPKSRGSLGIWISMKDGAEIISAVYVDGVYLGKKIEQLINGKWIARYEIDQEVLSNGGEIYNIKSFQNPVP